MSQSESIKSLMAAVGQVQAQFLPITRTSSTQVGQQSVKYADLVAITLAIKPLLVEAKLVYVQPMVWHDGRQMIRTILTHTESGEWLDGLMELQCDPKDPRRTGAVVTYFRRYSLTSLLGIVTTNEDSDATDGPARRRLLGKKVPVNPPAQPPRQSQRPPRDEPRPESDRRPEPAQASTQTAAQPAPAAVSTEPFKGGKDAVPTQAQATSMMLPAGPKLGDELTRDVPTYEVLGEALKALRLRHASADGNLYPEWTKRYLEKVNPDNLKALVTNRPDDAVAFLKAMREAVA